MLKWTVYGKKNQDIQINNDDETDEAEPYTHKTYDDKVRRSLDAQTVKKSKKPSRYQRRSLGAAARKNNCRNVDKENINCVGNTPNHFREGFMKKIDSNALKDVSNITPTSGNPNIEKRMLYRNASKDDIPPDLPPTPPTYSRRVREAKKRKLETSCNNNVVFNRNSCIYKSERRIKQDRSLIISPKLSHSVSEPSLNELSERLSSSSGSNKSSFVIAKQISNKKTVSTTKTASEGLVEIEYDKDLVINCVEKPVIVDKTNLEKCTLPIFGHCMFTDNPLYFNKKEDGPTNIRPLKRTRKKSNEFESSFKSPSIDKKDVHSLVRDGCSPSITPLSVKLAALRFSTMSAHTKSQRAVCNNDITEFFPKVDIPFTIPLKDEESSTEMENKFILGKDSINSTTESTVSTTQMGDITLERMIEDIIKSTKIVKSKRRILTNMQPEDKISIEEEIPTIETIKDLFVKPQTEMKTNLIKEARYVNLSRENSVSPKTTPTKKRAPIHRVNDKLLKNVPIGGFILDDGDGYNEREVRTPDKCVDVNHKSNVYDRVNMSLNRSRSMNSSLNEKRNLDLVTSESTPDLYSALRDCKNSRWRRQKCIRRKKSTVSIDSIWKQKQVDSKSSLVLTLEMGLPSPAIELQNSSLCEPISAAYSEIVPIEKGYALNNSIRSNVSHSSLKTNGPVQNKRSRELFGLTLENGIPSPITPLPNLKRSSNVLSEERARKTSKLEVDLLSNGLMTPVLEHKTSRRCLTYSPEDSSISSSEEKRQSVASNRLERSTDRFQALKGTIDLEIVMRNDIIDVHVIRCRDLQRSSGKVDEINAYAKVVISGVAEDQSLPSQRSIFQRTSVLYGKREPEFQRHLKLPLPNAVYDHQMLHISVWHRDKKYRKGVAVELDEPTEEGVACEELYKNVVGSACSPGV
ncbi:jg20440 [Pararge aegeria aegeria]|uniref:Jg20440 protein n=1 Tax=Pararge aegeria aegeria TaxID=348720 RepID=A0A8S4RZ81_9NEOP|nr:jg20440 [Pararge aegeria aegeria]